MELGTHHVMAVPCDDVYAGSGLVVPDPHGLVVGGCEDPGEFVVEERRTDVVDVA